MIFDHAGNEQGKYQLEHEQILPKAGWVEHNPVEIWERTVSVMRSAMGQKGLSATDLAACGITNQRETAVVWDRKTGRPYYNAIVWQDTRTDRIASPWSARARATSSGRRPGCRRRRTSRPARCSGSSRTSTACARRPSAATRSSATPTRG
jgi:glycerol kinase